MNMNDRRVDAGLRRVEELLREQVPRATGFELDRIRLRATRSRHAGLGKRRDGLMRSRIAVTMMLAAGFLFSCTGVGLAVSGISSSGSAATSQYASEQAPGQGVAGETTGGGHQNQNAQGDTGSGNQAAAQQASQVAVTGGDNSLPFTGVAAIPLLLAGIGLTVTGFAFRRAATRS
jgi:hypothetical protein